MFICTMHIRNSWKFAWKKVTKLIQHVTLYRNNLKGILCYKKNHSGNQKEKLLENKLDKKILIN